MEPKNETATSHIDKTKFAGDGIKSATDFAKMVGCSLNGVKKMIDDKKLTEGFSYLKDNRAILIDVEKARHELRSNTNPNTCKNPQLLEFIGLSKAHATGEAVGKRDELSDMSAAKVLEEMRKSELRISWIEEKILEEKYVERKKVEKNLEAIGMEVRNNVLAVAARIAPRVILSKDAREAENLINRELEEALLTVSGIRNKDISA